MAELNGLEPLAHYRQRLEAARQTLQAAHRDWSRVGWLRGSAFLLSLGLLIAGWAAIGGTFRPWLWGAGGVFLLFLAIVFWHEWLGDTIRTCRLRVQLYRDAVARWERRLKEIPVWPVNVPENVSDVSRDLDLYGPHSLHKLLASVHTPEGVVQLGAWLGQPAVPVEIRQRQLAARSLAAESGWREDFELLVRRLAGSPPAESGAPAAAGRGLGVSALVGWCESPSWLGRRLWLLWLARIGAAVVIGALAGWFLGLLSFAVTGPILMAFGLLNFFLAVFFSGSIHDEFNRMTSGHRRISVYRKLFDMIDRCPARGGRLDDLRERLFQPGADVRKEIGHLGRLASFASLRNDALFFIPWLMLQFTLFYDIHILVFLEAWKARHGRNATLWFRALGEWETLAALGRLAWDHPDWCWPEVVDSDGRTDRIEAVAMGHPLIATSLAVTNPAAVGPQGRFLLVTGSNMSGKSTLLRSLGLNVFLAQLGAPAFARSLRLPCCEVSTSMRVSDSLADGVSFFMAELKRLKAIVDRADPGHREPGRGHLFLLDEILQGTNSRERQIAVAAVLEALTSAGSIGAISTHDLELASHPGLANACDTVHFREHFVTEGEQQRMVFDYVMRPGISPTTNALKLLELVGLKTSLPKNT